MQTHNQWSVSIGERVMRYICDIKFEMLQVREREISHRANALVIVCIREP